MNLPILESGIDDRDKRHSVFAADIDNPDLDALQFRAVIHDANLHSGDLSGPVCCPDLDTPKALFCYI